jgi:hypothetical protein
MDLSDFDFTTNVASKFAEKRGSAVDTFYRGRRYGSIKEAWGGLNSYKWRFGITINQGLGWNVSQKEAQRRLNYIRVRLLRAMFGNNFARKRAAIKFMVFRQGSWESGNQHWHALMAVEGDHDWSDAKIAIAIEGIEGSRSKKRWEKDAYVDCEWNRGNRFHRYLAREVKHDADSVMVL